MNQSQSKRGFSAFLASVAFSLTVCLILMGAALPVSAQVTAAQASVNFTSVAVGASATQSFLVQSTNPLVTVSVTSQNNASGDFSLATGNLCTTGASGSCSAQIQFQPQSAGVRLGAVVFADGSGNSVTVPLIGIGTGPVVAFGPGTISTFAGTPGTKGNLGDGSPATQAQLAGPRTLAMDGAGNLYIADQNGNAIRMVKKSDGTIATVAGTGSLPVGGVNGDGGPATAAELNGPMGVAMDGVGNLYIADTGDNVIRVVNVAGTISTVVGGGTACAAATDTIGDGCPALNATLNAPQAVAVDGAGNLYIADTGNNVIRMVSSAGTITTIAGTPGVAGFIGDGGPAAAAQFTSPVALQIDGAGNLYIADAGTDSIRSFALPGGTVSTLAGVQALGGGYTGDGGPATSAQLASPGAIALDAAGDLYIADTYNQVVRKVTPAGMISTVAGYATATGGAGGYGGDGGLATAAQFNFPFGLALDGSGNLYIADYQNYAVRKVDVSDSPSLQFGVLAVGQTSAAQDVAVMNLGNALLTVGAISVDPSFSLGGADTNCVVTGQTIAAATQCVLGIEFSPTATGSVTGNVSFTSNSLTGGTQTIALSGTADLTQSITFPNPGPQTYGVSPITLGATATSTLPVTYTVTSGPATVSGSVLTITGAGSVTVQAAQAGDSTYAAAAPVSVTFTVSPLAETYNISAAQSAVSISAGSSSAVNLTLNSTNYSGTVNFTTSVTSTNGTPAAVSATVASVNLTSGGNATAVLNISTTSQAANHAPALPWKSTGALAICAVLLGAPLTMRRKRALAILLSSLALAMAGFLMACGGGSSSSSASKSTTPAAARTYVVTITPAGTATPAGAVNVTDPSPVSITVTVQ